MKLTTPTISNLLYFAAGIFIFSIGHAQISCPKIVLIEEGGSSNVSCDTNGRKVELVYWYTGDPAISSPILRLENGKPGGTEYGKGHYSITRSGGMTITNASLTHEKIYTILIYFKDETREAMRIMVNVTISPWHSCPVISDCNPCEECSFFVNDTGKITCSINGTRPMIPLKWTIEAQEGVKILQHLPISVTERTSEAWNSSAALSYKVSSCNQMVTLQCEAEDKYNLLNLSQSLIRLYTANCSNISLDFTTAKHIYKVVVIAALSGVPIFVISTILLLTFKCFRSFASKDATEKMSLTEVSTSSPPRKLDQAGRELASFLKTKYKESGLFDYSSNGEDITLAKLFSVCNYKVDLPNETSYVIAGNKLQQNDVIRKKSRVLITGGPRHWKTILINKFVQHWIDNKENDFILLHIRTREVEADVKLIIFLEQGTSINRDFLLEGMLNNKCILLLDGLHRIVSDGKERNNSQTKFQQRKHRTNGKAELFASMTVSDLFQEMEETSFHSEIQICVASCHYAKTDEIFPLPFAKIQLANFEEKRQFDDLVERVCKEFTQFSCRMLSESQDDNISFIVTSQNQTRDPVFIKNELDTVAIKTDDLKVPQNLKLSDVESYSDMKECEPLLCGKNKTEESIQDNKEDDFEQLVKKHVDENRIFYDHKDTPFLLALMVLIVVKRCIQQHYDYDKKTSITPEKLTCEAVRHLQKAYFMIHKDEISSESCDVDTALGKMALHLMKENRLSKQHDLVIPCHRDINLATEIGLLQFEVAETEQRNEKNTDLLFMLKFVHPHIMYYFGAMYIKQNEECFKDFLAYEYDKRHCTMKFIVILKMMSLEKLVKDLQQLKLDDDVIDCLHEWENQEAVEELLPQLLPNLSKTDIHISSLDKERHLTAFQSFLKRCSIKQTTLNGIAIEKNVPVSVLTSLDLTAVNTLILPDREVSEMDFFSILKCLSGRAITIRFQNCRIGEKFSEDMKKNMNGLEGKKLKVIHQRIGLDCSSFNYKTATWQKETSFMKTVKENLPTPSNLKKVLLS